MRRSMLFLPGNTPNILQNGDVECKGHADGLLFLRHNHQCAVTNLIPI